MYPTSPIPAVLAIFTAFFTCLVLARKFGPPDDHGRFLAIDGLRGYLAFGVFLHHSMIWYFYLKTNQWVVSPSSFYTYLGQSGVALFFMITGFLFFSKILAGKTKQIDWLRLYVSRFLRLMPLYGIAMCALLIVVYALSGAQLNEPIHILILKVLQWMSFTIFGSPDINDIKVTSLVLAGVTWSLPYEWYFYLLLPIFALINRVRVGWLYLAISVCTIVFIFLNTTLFFHWFTFLGGVCAAYVVRSEYLCRVLRSRIASVAAILLVIITVIFFPTNHGFIRIILLSVAFSIIAAGNGIFGLLTNNISRTLGELSYSIYLLHGLLLFILFRFVIGLEKAEKFSPIYYWSTIIAVTPFLIILAFLCYKKIEYPALLKTSALTYWLRNTINFRAGAIGQDV